MTLMLSRWIAELRFTLRYLIRTPGFSLTAILALALGIGANTAIFSAVNALLLGAMPYDHLSVWWAYGRTPLRSVFRRIIPLQQITSIGGVSRTALLIWPPCAVRTAIGASRIRVVGHSFVRI